ncbi:RCC1 repeat-containing protein, partial [bacterium]|nr:RCC1 repeat-containing protein [bacterium]
MGDGTNLMRSTPVLVSGLSAIAVGAGASHSVALQSSGGTIVTWGNNDFGQLGNGAAIAVRTDSKVPVALSGTNLPVFSAIAVGANHTLALSGGKVWAWGANGDGQLGNNTRTDSATPVQVLDSAGNALTGVRAITAGANHSLALVGNVVWAWGRNSQGQLGIATATPYKATAITTLTGVTAIAAGGEHSLALIDDGTVRTWGSNWAGQLGNLSKTDSATPITVLASASTSLTKVVKIAAGNAYSLALLSNGQVLAWGYGAAGQVGSASSRDNPTPVVVIAANPDITALAAGDNHAFALKTTDGTVLAWGDNGRGQLGDGTLTFRQEAVVIPNLPAPTNIFAGAYHLMSKGAAGASSNDKSWGSNWKGQLAEAAPSLYKPAPTLSLLSATPIAAGAAHTLSGVQSVGDNQAAELGRIPPGTPIPTWTASIGAVGGLPTSVTSVAAGTRHSLAAFGKDIWVWGANEAGQLGNGST